MMDVTCHLRNGGSRLAVADLLHTYPVALLVKES